MKNVKNRIVSVALSIVTAISATASCLPAITIKASAINTGTEALSSRPSYMDATTSRIYRLFGDLYKDGLSYTSNTGTEIKGEPNVHIEGDDITTDEINLRNNYVNDIMNDGFKFTMSKNLNCDNQVLYRNGREYDPKDTTLGKTGSPDTNGGFLNNNWSDYNGSVGGTININGTKIPISPSDQSEEDRKQGKPYEWMLNHDSKTNGCGGYVCVLKDSDKGTLAYKYKNVGEYNGKSVDVKLTVMDFDVADELGDAWINYKYTAAEYKSFTSAQKACCYKLANPITNASGVKYEYFIPYVNYTKARMLNIPRAKEYRYYYSPKLVFRTNAVGINQLSTNWVSLKYEFFEAGTDTPIQVKGYTCWRDVDCSQGVSFKQSDIQSGKVKKFGIWLNNVNPVFNQQHFFKGNYKGPDDNYIGYFESNQYSTVDDDDYAWLYATFDTTTFTTLYSFAGPVRSRTSGNSGWSNETKHLRHIFTSSSGTISNELPSINITGNINISKEVILPEQYYPIACTKDRVPDLHEALRFYIKDSKGYFINVKWDSAEDAYVYKSSTEVVNDNINNMSSSQLIQFPDDSHSIMLINMPIDAYTIYECIDPAYAKAHPEIVGKYDVSQLKEINMSVTSKGKPIDWNKYASGKSDLLRTVFFRNYTNTTDVNLQKRIITSDDKTINADSTNKKLLDNVKFAIRNSNNEYAEISSDGNVTWVTWSEDEVYFKMPNGSLKNIKLPYGTYTLIEKPINSVATAIWNVNSNKDFTIDGTTCTKEKDGSLTYNLTIDNQELYGGISVQKTTETGEDISGIEFILNGTSDSGRQIKMSMTTDKNGNAKLEKVPVGTYTLSENPDTVNTKKMAGCR